MVVARGLAAPAGNTVVKSPDGGSGGRAEVAVNREDLPASRVLAALGMAAAGVVAGVLARRRRARRQGPGHRAGDARVHTPCGGRGPPHVAESDRWPARAGAPGQGRRSGAVGRRRGRPAVRGDLRGTVRAGRRADAAGAARAQRPATVRGRRGADGPPATPGRRATARSVPPPRRPVRNAPADDLSQPRGAETATSTSPPARRAPPSRTAPRAATAGIPASGTTRGRPPRGRRAKTATKATRRSGRPRGGSKTTATKAAPPATAEAATKRTATKRTATKRTATKRTATEQTATKRTVDQADGPRRRATADRATQPGPSSRPPGPPHTAASSTTETAAVPNPAEPRRSQRLSPWHPSRRRRRPCQDLSRSRRRTAPAPRLPGRVPNAPTTACPARDVA